MGKEKQRESSPGVGPPHVKELESLNLNLYIFMLIEVEGRDLQRYWVPVGALKPNKRKDLNARTATNIILVLVDG